MVSFVIGLEFFGIGLILVALLLLINGDGAREQKLLIFIMAGSLVQNVGYLLELSAPTVEAVMTAGAGGPAWRAPRIPRSGASRWGPRRARASQARAGVTW